ncbi:MAG: GNAT family N-acetyltransferase [Gammaproteobacteria bacterium]|nr:GNAT family N-acetyltransferase [Gammaproteobacteria bacterium]
MRVRAQVPPRLLAIAVDENYRGLGVASELTSQFCTEMKDAGFVKVELSALSWNRRAIGFYKRDRWLEESRSETSICFSRLL